LFLFAKAPSPVSPAMMAGFFLPFCAFLAAVSTCVECCYTAINTLFKKGTNPLNIQLIIRIIFSRVSFVFLSE
ncbi:MAG: hypothetical protein LBE96_22285, partial [Kalamiella piersonii]|uniref:hypothetical protein n=1 Tax=Pantoea piersonii TaxID=2364647 RepID=UPI00242C257C